MNSNYLEFEYERGKFEMYVLDILSLGLCNAFFSVSVRTKKDNIIIGVDFQDYTKLSDFSQISKEEKVWIMEELRGAILQGENHFIGSGMYELSPETLFVNLLKKKVKVFYVKSNSPAVQLKALREINDFMESIV